MPPFSDSWEKVADDYYKLRFFPDGFPGKLENGQLREHPIYGVYVLTDYVKQYWENPNPGLLDAIMKVATAAIDRMQEFEGALVFWYPGDGHVARAHQRYYSGLTQGYYMYWFYEVYRLTGDERFKAASEKVFRSLLIPADKGGVYYSWGDGNVSIAELPTQPNGLILNGWQSILVSLHNYAKLTGSREAHDLFMRSAQTMAKLLPLYDAEEYANSRYSLTGFQYAKLSFANTSGVVIKDIKHEVPGEGFFDVPVRKASRWQYFVVPKDARETSGGIEPLGRTLRLNLIVSRLPYPKENVLHLSIDSPRDMTMDVSLYVGRYSPLSSSQTNESWQPVTSVNIHQGTNEVSIPLPWEFVELTAYPTNFLKKISGKNYNVYHYVHIRRLAELYALTHIEEFIRYSKRWESFAARWPEMALYEGLEHARLQ